MGKGNTKKLMFRPNDKCLFCSAPLTRPPTHLRAYYYCGDDCWKPCNRSVRFFSPETQKKSGRGTPVHLLVNIWWVLSNADTPLTGALIHERVVANFGDHTRISAKRGIHRLLNYFKPEFYERLDTKPIEYQVVKDIPFKDALKTKFSSAIIKYQKPVPKKQGNTP